MKQVLLYLQVIHAGYEAFLQHHSDAGDVMLVRSGFKERFPSLAKDIRALAPARAADYVRIAVPRTRGRASRWSSPPTCGRRSPARC